MSGNQKVQAQMSTAGVAGHPNQTIFISAESVKKREVRRCPGGRRHSSDWLIPDFFHRLLALIDTTGKLTCLNWTSDFSEGVCNAQCPSKHTRYAVSPYSGEDRLFLFPRIFYMLHCCKQLIADNHPFQKLIIVVLFEQRITGRNAYHSSKHRGHHVSKCFQKPYNVYMRYLDYLCDIPCVIRVRFN